MIRQRSRGAQRPAGLAGGKSFSGKPDLLGIAAVRLGGEPARGIHRAKLLSGQFFRDNFQGSVQTNILMKARMKRILAGLAASGLCDFDGMATTPSKSVTMNHEQTLRRRIKLMTCLLIVGLILSGVTVIPLQYELNSLTALFGFAGGSSELVRWLLRVRDALAQTQTQYPFLFYGTDWLAFGHFVIAIAFVGALRDPVHNRWLFDFGITACVLVIPYALVFGGFRGIPIWWRLIDCSFGVFGFIPLWLCRKWVIELEQRNKSLPNI